jgi:hypothetical protein
VLTKLHELTVQRCGVAADEEPPSAGAHAACLDAAARLAAASSAIGRVESGAALESNVESAEALGSAERIGAALEQLCVKDKGQG